MKEPHNRQNRPPECLIALQHISFHILLMRGGVAFYLCIPNLASLQTLDWLALPSCPMEYSVAAINRLAPQLR
jgi:hypothetical protein